MVRKKHESLGKLHLLILHSIEILVILLPHVLTLTGMSFGVVTVISFNEYDATALSPLPLPLLPWPPSDFDGELLGPAEPSRPSCDRAAVRALLAEDSGAKLKLSFTALPGERVDEGLDNPVFLSGEALSRSATSSSSLL